MSRAGIAATLAIFCWIGLAPLAGANRYDPASYPRLGAHARYFFSYSESQWDTLSRFDMLSTKARPEEIAEMRRRNPHQRIFFRHMPQIIPDWSTEGDWQADTLHCLFRLSQFYALQNDWYLYDIHGERMMQWGGYAANWTRYCPRGVYGTSKGLTFSEWFASVAMPQIMTQSPAWGEPWGWGSRAYDGIAWEVLTNCPACCAEDEYLGADPDRDGLPEDIEGTCWNGGADDSLAILFTEANDDFYQRIRAWIDPALVIVPNWSVPETRPSWQYELNGLKLENWRPSGTSKDSWWSLFYGRRRSGGRYIGDGYHCAERYMNPSGPDSLNGWDVTWIHLWNTTGDWTPEYAERMRRYGMGTAMLGDGYFLYDEDPVYPHWFDIYDYDFGRPLGDYQREYTPPETLYVRLFEKGFVEVNPYFHPVRGVPAEDSRFGFWLTIADLAVDSVGVEGALLSWSAPAGLVNGVDTTELRLATEPLTPENWEQASKVAGTVLDLGGGRFGMRVAGLQAETRYYFAVKNQVFERWEPRISNVVSLATEPAPPAEGRDETPPAAILDLRSPEYGPDWVALAWTASGDDGAEGRAAGYLLRRRAGAAILDEGDWSAAEAVAGLPVPGEPGDPQGLTIGGLAQGGTHGFSLRSVDEAGNLSPLSNPLVVVCPPPPDAAPPATIADLRIVGAREDGFDLAWTAPGDDGPEGTAARYVLARALDQRIEGEAQWLASTRDTLSEPRPAAAGTPQAFALHGLLPGRDYGLALRAYDEAGNLSGLALPALGGRTLEPGPPPPPPDTIPPAAIDDLALREVNPGSALLAWTNPGDDGAEGRAERFVLGWRAGEALEGEEHWALADTLSAGLPSPGEPGETVVFLLAGLEPETSYAAAVRAYDDAGLVSPPGSFVGFRTPAPSDTIAPGRVDDLATLSLSDGSVGLRWTAAGDDGLAGTAAWLYLAARTGGEIVTESDWDASQRESHGNDVAGGAPDSLIRAGILPGSDCTFAVRYRDESGLLGPISNQVRIAIPAPPPPPPPADTIPPGAIEDLAATGIGTDWVLLTWSCPGDDGDSGRADRFVLGWAEGESLDSEAEWDAASRIADGLPSPGDPGEAAEHLLEGLPPGGRCAIAVRALDDAGQLSPLAGALAVVLFPPDSIAPGRVTDLACAAAGGARLRLDWTAAGDDGFAGRAEAFILARRADQAIESEEDWQASERDTLEALVPGGERDSLRLDDLPPGGWGFALRYLDEAGACGPISNFAVAAVPAIPDPADPDSLGGPDTVAPAPLADLRVALLADDAITLAWSPGGDDGVEGEAARYRVGLLPGERLNAERWVQAEKREIAFERANGPASCTGTIAGLVLGASYGIAVEALDEQGNASGPSNAVWVPALRAMDEIAPRAVDDLAVVERGADWLALSWTAPHDPAGTGTAEEAELRWAPCTPADSARATGGVLLLGRERRAQGERDSLRLEGLQPETGYRLSLRTRNSLGLWSAASNAPEGATSSADSPASPIAGLDLAGPFPHPIRDEARFVLSLPPADAGEIRVQGRIYTIAGVPVRRWLDETFPAGAEAMLRWDGRNDDGTRVAPGLYLLRLACSDGGEMLRKVYVSR